MGLIWPKKRGLILITYVVSSGFVLAFKELERNLRTRVKYLAYVMVGSGRTITMLSYLVTY